MTVPPRTGHRREGRWLIAPLSDFTTPKPGWICLGPRWWCVTENDEVLFFDTYCSPQCNINRTIVERLGSGFGAPPTTPKFIEMTFLPHNCGDYV